MGCSRPLPGHGRAPQRACPTSLPLPLPMPRPAAAPTAEPAKRTAGTCIGRFAPSPSGPLHAGSVVAALGSWLDARAQDGRWLLRIEDIDPPRVEAGAIRRIQQQLRFLGLHWDAPPWYQSARTDRYQAAFKRLHAQGRLFGCACTRREIALAWQQAAIIKNSSLSADETPYPGTCRNGLPAGRSARAWRFRITDGPIHFEDRWLGPQQQYPAHNCGDFVLRRADGIWAYQLAVVVDDAEAGITDIVRGADLLGSTGRQIQLQQALGYPTPRYLHLPLLIGANGQKLSKQNAAPAIDDSGRIEPADILDEAASFLGLRPPQSRDTARWLAAATEQWRERFVKKSGT